jgi:hypothetical protein
MYSLKKSLIALVGLLVIVGVVAAVMPLVGRGQGQGQSPFTQRTYYLTQTTHNGSQASTACASGYHMASLYEIIDPSNLRYNTELGSNNADSGFGPPTGQFGWIRTGQVANDFDVPGFGNCNAWFSASSFDRGTIAHLTPLWESLNVTVIAPWESPSTADCNQTRKVWCVQD